MAAVLTFTPVGENAARLPRPFRTVRFFALVRQCDNLFVEQIRFHIVVESMFREVRARAFLGSEKGRIDISGVGYASVDRRG